MTIARLIEGRDGVVSCNTGTSVSDAVKLLAEQRIGAVPVLENGKIAGIFSERDVVYGLRKDGPGLLDRRVGDVMTKPPVTADPAMQVLVALSLMTRRRIRHLPVIADGRMVDFVSIGDLVKYRIDRIEAEAEAMRDYIQSA